MGFIINPYTSTGNEVIEFDMSTSDNWTFTGSSCSINTGSEYLQGSSAVNNDRGNSEIQSGFTLNDAKFVIRQKFQLTTVTAGNYGQLYFGYTNVDNSVGVIGARDGLGITVRTPPDFLLSYANDQAWQGVGMSTTPSVTTYYLELIRNSATSFTVTLYSDSNYSTVIETITSTISADITGLKYIMIGGWDNGASGVIIAQISEIVIYDGVVSV